MTHEWLADDAHRVFSQLSESLASSDDNNEAQTRLRIIDAILFNVLKWDRNSVRVESHVKHVGYSDYEFGPKTNPCMILEAKKENIHFILPERAYPSEPVPFSLLSAECKDAAAALTQAQSYANQRGARYSAISNGHQWLISMTFVPGQAIHDRLVYVFESFDAINHRKFRVFFECFSPLAMHTNKPSERLLATRKAPAPARISSALPGYPAIADRNPLSQDVGGTLQSIWDEIDTNQSSEIFLKHCYITADPSEDLMTRAQMMLTQRAVTDERLASSDILPATRKTVIEQNARSDHEQPVVILGRIGHGKSTFLKYLRHVAAKDILSSKYIQLDLDFLHTPANAADVPPFVMRQIEQQLRGYNISIKEDSFSRRVLKHELELFRKSSRGVFLKDKPEALAEAEVGFIESIIGDEEQYMTLVMKFIRRSHQKSVAVFFDNLDRRPDDIQEQAFLRAAAIAHDWGVLVFVCLRPGTLQRSTASGVLDTMAPRVLLIPRPQINIVLRKRFQYASRYAAGSLPREAYKHGPISDGEDEQCERASCFFSICDQSIHRNPSLALQYEAVSNGNIRKVMQYVKKVITSGHLDTGKIIGIHEKAGHYCLAEHETLRALIYGSYRHFDPNDSLFTNLFDLRNSDPIEHFSRVLLLDYCHRHANSVDRYGFISVGVIREFMAAIGYSGEHVEETLGLLVKRDCLEGQDECRDREGESPVLGAAVRITSLGSFHVTTVARKFQYMDAISIDTPILEDSVRGMLRWSSEILARLHSTRLFTAYLERQASHLCNADAIRVVVDICQAVYNDIADIEEQLRSGQ